MKEDKPIIEQEYKETDTQAEDTARSANYDTDKIPRVLYQYGFIISDNKLIKIMDNGKPKTISNFIPIVNKKIIYDNGIDKIVNYKVSGILLERNIELPEIEISKQEYNTFKFIIGSNWDDLAIVEGNNHIYCRQVAQILSKETMDTETIYNHTGFIRLDNKLQYLYHGGVIGDKIETKADLSNDGLEQYNFTKKVFNIPDALKTSFSILDTAERRITIPLLAITYLAPLTSILKEEGIYIDSVVYLVGKSGTRKSSISAILVSHYGTNFHRNTFPCSFRDTINNLEKKVFVLKDCLNVQDDYNPEQSKLKTENFKEILGMYGDRLGRGRMKADGTGLRKAYTARGCCIATGEIIPDIPLSRLARLVIIPIKSNSIDLEKLTYLQNNRELLAFCMMRYIKWIIDNEVGIRQLAKTTFNELQKSQNNQMHGRTNEATNTMLLGYGFFMNFLQDNGIINGQQKSDFLNEAKQVLLDLSNNQQQEIESSNPVDLFYDAIEELLQTRKIYLLDYKTGVENNRGNNFLGYIDREKGRYYLFPKAIYNEVCRFYSASNSKFPLSYSSLWKYLQEGGLLYMTDDSRKTVLRTTPINGEKIRVVDIAIRNIVNEQQE